MPRVFNQEVEDVIAESSKPVLVRLLLAELDAGTLDEAKQQAAMGLLQDYGIDLFELGKAFLSQKTADEIERIASGEIDGDAFFMNWGKEPSDGD